eukprot:CAMPEP_0174281032 /NCGR_PEP_ID=MMETSP0809-20121228/1359_1 /TAXON_ID=73025 ORGANISM="Eutreptiella gymnastica-like, Strain CCMP1594" /NCGR_SAMPLE_ID=MMETSP0809 /ASSEMBLY_ACC=CAM_ASM_000658 /LENGTH=68 /DNA_ID=CAMNT_0015374299 /DNA_START=990 /DNA_END=1196 /DNA_ORIENTATION=-
MYIGPAPGTRQRALVHTFARACPRVAASTTAAARLAAPSKLKETASRKAMEGGFAASSLPFLRPSVEQ